jgi:tRNA(fMet)-specific endonuclease VapC
VAVRLLIDTNRYTDMVRGDLAVTRTIEAADLTCLSVIALGELRAGFLGGSRAAENERTLRIFLRKATVQLLAPDEGTTLHYATIYQQLRREGTRIPTNDMWIAALAIQHSLTLYARDAHFAHLPQLMRL